MVHSEPKDGMPDKKHKTPVNNTTSKTQKKKPYTLKTRTVSMCKQTRATDSEADAPVCFSSDDSNHSITGKVDGDCRMAVADMVTACVENMEADDDHMDSQDVVAADEAVDSQAVADSKAAAVVATIKYDNMYAEGEGGAVVDGLDEKDGVCKQDMAVVNANPNPNPNMIAANDKTVMVQDTKEEAVMLISEKDAATKEASKKAIIELAEAVTVPIKETVGTAQEEDVGSTPEEGVGITPKPVVTNMPEKAVSVVPEKAVSVMPEEAVSVMPEEAVSVMPEEAVICMPEEAVSVMPEDAVICMPEKDVICLPEEAVSVMPEEAVNCMPEKDVV